MLKDCTRALLRKKKTERGRAPLSLYSIKYRVGDRVVVRPSTEDIHLAPNRNFCGKIGVIERVHRRTYLVDLKRKKVNTSSIHLRRVT